MTSSRSARTTTRRLRVTGLLVLAAAIAVAAGQQWQVSTSSTASPTSTATPPIRVPRDEALGEVVPADPPARDRGGALGLAGGAVPDGTTVFDDVVPGVVKLDPELLGALRRAAGDAADDGVGLFVDSAWRSRAYQERLLQDAVAKYGSEAEAARWVATPDRSAHVSGDAVDIGPSEAAAWLSEHGAAYGLCQIYGNESWHFELRPEAGARGCPPLYADPTHDPRMQP